MKSGKGRKTNTWEETRTTSDLPSAQFKNWEWRKKVKMEIATGEPDLYLEGSLCVLRMQNKPINVEFNVRYYLTQIDMSCSTQKVWHFLHIRDYTIRTSPSSEILIESLQSAWGVVLEAYSFSLSPLLSMCSWKRGYTVCKDTAYFCELWLAPYWPTPRWHWGRHKICSILLRAVHAALRERQWHNKRFDTRCSSYLCRDHRRA